MDEIKSFFPESNEPDIRTIGTLQCTLLTNLFNAEQNDNIAIVPTRQTKTCDIFRG